MSYATVDDLVRYGAPAAVLNEISTADKEATLTALSSELDAATRQAGLEPPLSYPAEVIALKLAGAAMYVLMMRLGYPNEQVAEHARKRYDDWAEFLKDVSNRRIQPVSYSASVNNQYAAVPFISSEDATW